MSNNRRAGLMRRQESERLGDHLAMAEASAGNAKPGRPATARRRPAKAADVERAEPVAAVAPDAEESAGLECPACGCRHFQVLSVRRAGDRVVRRHECRHCGRVVRTIETELGDVPPG